MSDPLAPGSPGDVSPFMTNFSTVDTAMKLLRRQRDQQGGFTGGGPLELPDLPPSSRVWIQNNSGADLNPYCVVALGAPLTSIADADNGSYEFRRRPNFSATTPTATTDAFAILDEPAPYVAGGNSPLVRAVVQGVIPVDVNVTDTSHGYATPTASDNTKLTSATSGPARILYKPSGTGTKRCVVLVEGSTGGGNSFTPTYATATSGSISVSSTYPTFGASGTTLSIPSAGVYLLFAMLVGQGLRPDTETSLWAQLYGAIYHSGGAEIFHVTCVGVDGDMPNASPGGPRLSNSGTGTICLPYTATGAETLELYTARSGSTTWSTSNVSGTIGYLKLS